MSFGPCVTVDGFCHDEQTSYFRMTQVVLIFGTSEWPMWQRPLALSVRPFMFLEFCQSAGCLEKPSQKIMLWIRTVAGISSSHLWSLVTDPEFSCSFCLSVIAVPERSTPQLSRHSDVACLSTHCHTVKMRRLMRGGLARHDSCPACTHDEWRAPWESSRNLRP